MLRLILQETPNGHKKKIIPVGSDFEGSPSPEFPSSPVASPKTESATMDEGEDKAHKSKNKLNFKWKSSVSKFLNFVSPFLDTLFH